MCKTNTVDIAKQNMLCNVQYINEQAFSINTLPLSGMVKELI